ncbi:hypothetical protein Pelo_4213 [Pelomyxa schiedti]|nr:hypothetical protein Pelo_4213 [Pelomyxa schiedti]
MGQTAVGAYCGSAHLRTNPNVPSGVKVVGEGRRTVSWVDTGAEEHRDSGFLYIPFDFANVELERPRESLSAKVSIVGSERCGKTSLFFQLLVTNVPISLVDTKRGIGIGPLCQHIKASILQQGATE